MRAYCKWCQQWVLSEQVTGGAAPEYVCTFCGSRV